MYTDILKYLRDTEDLSQEYLAKNLGIERGVYGMYETEYKIFPLKYLIKLCEIFNVSIDYMFKFSESKNYKNNNYEMDLQKSAYRLKNFRESFNLTLSELGKTLNCSISSISQIETGKSVISTTKLYELCKKYSLSADFMLGKTNSPKRIKPISKYSIDTKWEVKTSIPKLYSKRLKFLREEKKIKQIDLANYLGITRAVYSNYETENIIIPIKHLIKTAEKLSVSIDCLMSFSNERNYKSNNYKVDKIIAGERLKSLRNKLGYSKKRLAISLGCSESTIADYESGRLLISTRILYDLCKKYSISADWLLGKTNTPEKINLQTKNR